MKNECEPKVALKCKKYGFSYMKQDCKFGYERLLIEFDSIADLYGMVNELRKIKGASVRWDRRSYGGFYGWITVMDEDKREDLDAKLKEEADRLEDWWQRYHVADEETRRLMACGAIS